MRHDTRLFPSCSPCLDSSWLSLAASNLKKPFLEASELKQIFQEPQTSTPHMRSQSSSGPQKTQLPRMAVARWYSRHAVAMTVDLSPSAPAPLTSRYVFTSIQMAVIQVGLARGQHIFFLEQSLWVLLSRNHLTQRKYTPCGQTRICFFVSHGAQWSPTASPAFLGRLLKELLCQIIPELLPWST